jgi:hypothetical protein
MKKKKMHKIILLDYIKREIQHSNVVANLCETDLNAKYISQGQSFSGHLNYQLNTQRPAHGMSGHSPVYFRDLHVAS